MFAIHPSAVTSYRDRHHVPAAKSNAGDAKLLADVVRTDRHNHRDTIATSAKSARMRSRAVTTTLII